MMTNFLSDSITIICTLTQDRSDPRVAFGKTRMKMFQYNTLVPTQIEKTGESKFYGNLTSLHFIFKAYT